MLKKENTTEYGETTRSEPLWWWHDIRACYPQKDSLINGASWFGALNFICKKGILHPNILLRLNNVFLHFNKFSLNRASFQFVEQFFHFFCISIEITIITPSYAKIQECFFSKLNMQLFHSFSFIQKCEAPLTNYVSIRYFIWTPSTFLWYISS